MDGRLKWYWSVVPALYAIAPLLTLYALNASEVSPLRITGFIFGVVLCTWAVSATLFIVVPGHRVAVAISGSTLAILFFNYRTLFEFLDEYVLVAGPVTVGPNKVVFALMLTAIGLGVTLSRLSADTGYRLVQLTGIIAVTLAIAAAVPAITSTIEAGRDDPGTIDPVVAGLTLPADGAAPDIYLIVLDSYTSDRSMQSTVGYDNSGFSDWLSSQGFYVVEDAVSNYAWTTVSLPSLLNMRYVHEEVSGNKKSERAHLDNLTQHSSVIRSLQGLGYEYVHVSSGLIPTDKAPLADSFFAARTNDLRNIALQSTALSAVGVPEWLAAREKYADVQQSLDVVEGVASTISGRPRFTFAHLIAPHVPFVIMPDGQLSSRALFGSTRGSLISSEQAYAEEVQGLNVLLRQAISTIKERSSRPFVIMLVGDHGAWVDEIRPLERNSVINAIFFSEGGYQQLYPRMSLVNSFRVVMNRFFGAELEILDDRVYFSEHDTPHDFADITEDIESSLAR